MHRAVRFSPFVWIAAVSVIVGAVVAGCSGGSHSTLPSTPVGSGAAVTTTQSASGSVAVTLSLPKSQVSFASLSSSRSAQYVSGKSQGVYITGTCLTGGGTITQNCTGASFPPVYADVSLTSPLCVANGGGQSCTISANPVPGFNYAISVAALDSKPTAEAASGYGTGFAATAHILSVGSAPNSAPATLVASPAPTPTALGPFISKGNPNNINIYLNAVATQFQRVPPDAGVTLSDNVELEAANGSLTGFQIYYISGDAAGNLISNPQCYGTYPSLSASSPGTPLPPLSCDNFAGPDGKQYALTVLSSLPTHVCTQIPGNQNPLSNCTGTGSTGAMYQTNDYANIFEQYANWYQEPPGVMTAYPLWDGIADNDTCTAIPVTTGATPPPQAKCGQPMPLSFNNNIPTTAMPLVGMTTGYSITQPIGVLLAPFVTTLSCGSNSGCQAIQTQSGCTGYCYQVALDNNGTATLTAYAYASGTSSAFTGNSGCYATPTTNPCLQIAVNNPIPLAPPNPPGMNISSCYTGLNDNTGLSLPNPPGCNAVPDPNAIPFGLQTLPAGTVDCLTSPSAVPDPNAVIAYIIPRNFTKGALATSAAALGTADAMNFTIQAAAPAVPPATGYCSFQVWAPARNGLDPTGVGSGNVVLPFPITGTTTIGRYSPVIGVSVASSGAVVIVPPGQTFP